MEIDQEKGRARRMKLWVQRNRRLAVIGLLTAATALSVVIAYLLRFDLAVPAEQRHRIPVVAAVAVAVKLLVFVAMGLHHGWWRWTDTRDILRLAAANVTGSAVFSALLLASQAVPVPRSIYVIDLVVCTGLTGALRMAARIARELALVEPRGRGYKNVLIYGAGGAGMALARELRMNRELKYRVVGFVDDNLALRGELVCGHRVLGPGREMIRFVQRLKRRGIVLDEVLISMPSATGRQVREAVSYCRAAGLPCRILPGLGGLLKDRALSGQLREIAVEDLLGREPIRLDKAQTSARLKDRVVLVTGAAGSIGSVLCRQIAVFEPALLILADQNESGLFHIDLEMRRKHPRVRVIPALTDIRNEEEVHELFRRHRVEVVYHAAAYKHVPMMEMHQIGRAHV